MEVRFDDEDLKRMFCEATFRGKWSVGLVKQYRKVVGFIKKAIDERDFRAMRSLNFEKLKGNRSHECSMRLNDQYRLTVEIHESGSKNIVVIKSIEDYH